MEEEAHAWRMRRMAVFAGILVLSAIFLPFGAHSEPLVIGDASEEYVVEVRDLVTDLPSEPVDVGYPSFMSPHAKPIALHGHNLFVVNTPSDTVDVIDTRSQRLITRIEVGIDPVSLAVRPDGMEVWVSNHISDSVSVIDTDPASPMYFHVVATIQDLDKKSRSTRFDEPSGIAFANNRKAYVALSSENQIAVIDVAARKVTRKIKLNAQDPRAIMVRGDRLYVIPFESNNKTQLSGGSKIDGDLVTFNAWDHSIRVNNVLSLGHVVDIVKHPKVPDRDLYIYDTETDKLVEVVDSLGTLLYGLTVDSRGSVFIAQTDARNDVNGRSGTQKHGLAEMENRAFLNQITRVDFNKDGVEKKHFINLEPLPPNHPAPDKAFATPFGIQVSDDDSTLFVTAAGSDKLVTVDAASGIVMGSAEVGSVPRGVVIQNGESGRPERAWVLNAVGNTISMVNVSNASQPKLEATVELKDPTHPAVKRGRIAFNSAKASTTYTFSCASCHPDGHTDQLLWVLKTPIVTGGDQIMPRSTMPIRGLRDTEPYHWDGIPGDPYGGNNSANIHGSVPPNSDVKDQTSSTRHLIDGGLASTMHMEGDPTLNDEGKVGRLTASERDDMAKFLLNVPYPPAQRRSYDNKLSEAAERGFELFHIKGDNDPGRRSPNVCGDCHRMPFWVSTNTPGTGMDTPTWRGAYDRFLILPQGRLNIIDFGFYRNVAERGQDERAIWQFSWGGRERFNPVWNMVLEGSTGYSGAFGRQLTLNAGSVNDPLTNDLLKALEESASEKGVVLEAEGILVNGAQSDSVKLQYNSEFQGGAFVTVDENRDVYSRENLLELAASGKFVATFTARHGKNAYYENPQPAIWTQGPIERQSGRQNFPILFQDRTYLNVSGRHIDKGAYVIVDGKRVDGDVRLHDNESVTIELAEVPPPGMHMIQLQNPDGLFSNDFIFHVVADDKKQNFLQSALEGAVKDYNLAEMKNLVEMGADVNVLPEDGGSALGAAALLGTRTLTRYLLSEGADINIQNRDGNTPLHIAAFGGHTRLVNLLLERGADPNIRNNNKQTPADVVASEWSDGLANFYRTVDRTSKVQFNLDHIQKIRPELEKLLRARQAQSKAPEKGQDKNKNKNKNQETNQAQESNPEPQSESESESESQNSKLTQSTHSP